MYVECLSILHLHQILFKNQFMNLIVKSMRKKESNLEKRKLLQQKRTLILICRGLNFLKIDKN